MVDKDDSKDMGRQLLTLFLLPDLKIVTTLATSNALCNNPNAIELLRDVYCTWVIGYTGYCHYDPMQLCLLANVDGRFC